MRCPICLGVPVDHSFLEIRAHLAFPGSFGNPFQMSSSSSSRRSFYDPNQPRLLTDQEIVSLTPLECDAACLQIDQILVTILQNIDADFGKSHRTITDKILPDLERYGEASKEVWEGFKFWQGFFEASANVKLSGNNEDSTLTDRSHQTDSGSQTICLDDDHTQVGVNTANSPFEILKEDLRQNLGIPPKLSRPPSPPLSAHPTEDTHQTTSTASLVRPPHWHDLSIDSPDVTFNMPVPQDVSLLMENKSGHSLNSEILLSPKDPFDQSLTLDASPSGERPSSRGQKMLLHQTLLREALSGAHKRRTTSTPAKLQSNNQNKPSTCFPPEVTDPNWNGLADLRKIPLDGLVVSSKLQSQNPAHLIDKSPFKLSQQDSMEESLRAGISPPQTIHFSVPRSKLAQTPSKEAARLITRDVLETARFRAGYTNPTDLEDSPPLEPPSVLREWTARGYESLFKSRAAGEVKDFQQGRSADLEPHSLLAQQPNPIIPPPSRDVTKSLIDLRDTDASSSRYPNDQRIMSSQRDDPFNHHPNVRPREAQKAVESGGLSYRPSSRARSPSFEDETDSPPGSPTFFGVRHEPKRSIKPDRLVFDEPRAGNLNEKPNSQTFIPMKPDQSQTIFGGNILESEPFEPSPLQGKRMRYTDPKATGNIIVLA
ncbi:hypothetical protein O181_065544 [Austropuccinia psidii MF-1]|uniref:DASH complex subunit ASK1 n=1 Tax=Austropuccinia psidii MF-1 TaxID=1389203 RepID=A0A9Q3ERN6_9BASI|nr:hypothetical protein [Austropuccinia psidii MF-1]